MKKNIIVTLAFFMLFTFNANAGTFSSGKTDAFVQKMKFLIIKIAEKSKPSRNF